MDVDGITETVMAKHVRGWEGKIMEVRKTRIQEEDNVRET